MNKIIERVDKWNDSKIFDNGKIVVINCCAVVLNDEFEHKYETLTEEVKGSVERIFKMTADYTKTLDIPSVEEIKAGIFEIAGRRWSKRVKYSFGEGLPFVNARIMLDVIQYLKVYEIKWDTVHKPILFEGKCGVAILMPLRKKSSVDDLEKGYYIL